MGRSCTVTAVSPVGTAAGRLHSRTVVGYYRVDSYDDGLIFVTARGDYTPCGEIGRRPDGPRARILPDSESERRGRDLGSFADVPAAVMAILRDQLGHAWPHRATHISIERGE